jgi:hypothetical protein
MAIFKFLDERESIVAFEVLEFFNTGDAQYYKLKIVFTNNYILYARELATAEENNYSFHLQDQSHNFICRWDNAPHHRELSTYPHHFHINNKVYESFSVSLHDVITYIENEMLN